MCGYCYLTGAQAAGEAAAFIGGPLAYAGYRKARRVLGLRDTAVAPQPVESGRRREREPLSHPRAGVASVADPAAA